MAVAKKVFKNLNAGDKLYVYAGGKDHGRNPRTIDRAKAGENGWKAIFGEKKGDRLRLTTEQAEQGQVELQGLTYSTTILKF